MLELNLSVVFVVVEEVLVHLLVCRCDFAFDFECCDDPKDSCILVLVPHHLLRPLPGNPTPLPLSRGKTRNEIYRFQISGGGRVRG